MNILETFRKKVEDCNTDNRYNLFNEMLSPIYVDESKYCLTLQRFNILLTGRKNTVRWFAASSLTAWLDYIPDKVFEMTVNHVLKGSEDLRMAIACCVWEHFFEKKQHHEKIRELLCHSNRNVRWVLAKSFTFLSKRDTEKYLQILSNDHSTYVARAAKGEFKRLKKLREELKNRRKRNKSTK